MSTQYDMFQAELEKARGLAVTAGRNPDWMAFALRAARQRLPYGCEIMAEDFRRILAPIVGEPKNPGAGWGALVNQAVMQRIVMPTGRFKKSTAVSNHRHKYATYRRP